MIGIIDYNAGNIASVQKAVEKLGYDAVLVDSPEQINACDSYILPGVGAFNQAMQNLAPLKDALVTNVKSGKYLLGICLGLQLLFDKSYEDGEYEGLHLIEGEVVRFPEDAGLKVPHMGWNKLVLDRDDELARGIDGHVYFVHSYYVKPADSSCIVMHAEYGVDVPAVVRNDNVVGMQFHPEKSSNVGMKLLLNYLEMCL
ncbi:MAG: imidazole glycerol phosphate synthase subunit HisH [Coriobacteriales bacterium]|nr:imidazole glycerol phosphate synthase subunit HisH [Coriobacteriales bacterium]